VTDASGSPIAHAQVLREDAIGTAVDPFGAYELCVLPVAVGQAQLQVVVRADGYGAVMIEAGLAGRVRHDFVLLPEATVTGRAVSRDGQPVSHAKIWIDRDDADRRRETEASPRLLAATDDAGRFRLAGIGPGRLRIGGAGAGMTATPVRISAVAGGSHDVVLTMEATGIVHGRVVQSGQPIAGAHIAVSGGSSEEAVSQVDGSFVLDRVPVGDVGFTASPYRARSPATVAVIAGARNDVVIEVEPLGSLRGTVRRHGAAVPGARVCAAPRQPPNTCGTADALGRYQLEGLEPGDYAVFADDAQVGARVRDVPITLALGERRELALELSGGARITGTVSDRGGAAAAGAHLRFTRREPRDVARCVSDLAGRFDCASMAGRGAYEVAVFAGPDTTVAFPFVGPAPAAIEIPDGDARIDGIRLVIDAARRAISGTIVDAAGAPVGDARVHAWGDGAQAPWLVPTPASASDADGGFRISELAPGSYTLEVQTADGGRRVQRGIAAGTQDVRLVVDTALCRNPALAGAAAPLSTTIMADEPRDIRARPPGRVVWDDRIELVGWNVPNTVRLGQDIEIALYYKVLRPVDGAWKIALHLAGPGWLNADHEPGDGQCPTSIWKPGEVIVDRFTTRLATDQRTGSYEVRIGFFTGWAPSWRNLPISDAPPELRHPSDGLVLTTIVVR
jgi:protocatechuate 3,4-dioxygenase beta subunit